ncbi:MAG: glycosyltransferase [Erysipelotrichaceae bacterium]|jgi:glycosyltransferase involved in cell wall biosynthesis|nr:glycosyltransferase [Erysipelotrichaceae bacterium]
MKSSKEILLSIIVPCYNAEKTLPHLLNSLLNRLPPEVEILFIDDLSSDNSLNIIRSYQETNSQIKLIPNDKKRYAAGARNLGIEIATGKYLHFIDADDYVANNYYELVIPELRHDYSVILFNIVRISKTIKYHSLPLTPNTPLPASEFENLVRKQKLGAAWISIFNTEIIKKHRLFFDETLTVGEDTLYYLTVYPFVESCFYLNQPLYYYRDNITSITKNAKIKFFYDDVRVYEQYKQLNIHDVSAVKNSFLILLRSLLIFFNRLKLTQETRRQLKAFLLETKLKKEFKQYRMSIKNTSLRIQCLFFLNGWFRHLRIYNNLRRITK